MPDEPKPVVQTDPTKTGSSTSEFKLAAVAMTAGAVLDGVSVLLAGLHETFPNASWLSVAMSVVGTLLMLATALGYQRSRALVKTAMLESGTAVALAKENKPGPS
jgi:hypothetical protein